MSIEEKIISLVEAPINNMGYELVRVKQIGNDTVQLMIDTDAGVVIEDCVKVTKLVNNILYVAEISGDYNLEVSSPGLDRPLIKPEHFVRFIGSQIKLNTYNLIDGRKRFVGKLVGFDQSNNQISLGLDNNIVVIDLSQVQSACLKYENDR